MIGVDYMRKHYYCKMVFYNKYGDYITIKKQFFCEQKELNKLVGSFISELRNNNELFFEYNFNGWEVVGID